MELDSKEKRIIKTARDHFVQFGFKKTSLDDIIGVAQVGKGTVYKYFKNKEDLFKRVAEVEYENMYTTLQLKIVEETDPVAKLKLYVLTRLQFTRDYFLVRGSNMMVFTELKNAYDEISPNNSREVSILTEIFQLGERRGRFKPDNSVKYATLLSRLITQFEPRWCQLPVEDAESEIESYLTTLLEGINL